jgi:nucleoid DNA-binding protein
MSLKRHITKKSQLDQGVALLLGEKVKNVSLITGAFLAAIVAELADGKDVRLDGLGRLRVLRARGLGNRLFLPAHEPPTKRYYVSFKKAEPLTRALLGKAPRSRDRKMEKLGVDESQADNEKVASEGCPECGAKVERHGNVLACPTHGTEPFEKKKK